ncbi:hypothetical protein [Yoonia sp.]|uniref:hypothetical protein n=1 Tax=Yoonia sp. TaxID=2212373 RepID=UPI0023B55EE9
MFRLLRLIFMLIAAFVAGMLYERDGRRTICENGGGLWIENICVGPEFTND